MQVRLVGSSLGHPDSRQYSMTLIVNDAIAIDAGCLGFISPLEVQQHVEHVFLSHCHLDHVGSLPLFLDNVYRPCPDCPTVYALESVWAVLREHVFNDAIWPDLIRLSEEESPFLRRQTLTPATPISIGNISVRPITLDHVVPTVGFLIEDGQTAIGICCDTQPTTEFWEQLNECRRLSAVFIEASFPNSMTGLAVKARHLTPRQLGEEAKKLRHEVPLIAIHIKPAFHNTIVDELSELGLARLHVGEPNKTYEF